MPTQVIVTDTPIGVVNGGTGDSSLTAYAVMCGGTTTTGAVQSIAALGSSGQVLTSGGAGALPTFTSAGRLVYLSQLSASNSASISFTSLITSAYNSYLLTYYNVFPITNTAGLNMQISTNNGSSYIATNYLSGLNRIPYNSATAANANSTTAYIITPGLSSTTTNSPGNGYVILQNMMNSAIPSCGGAGTGYSTASAAFTQFTVGSTNTANTNANAIQLAMNSGNISSGVFTLYGIKES